MSIIAPEGSSEFIFGDITIIERLRHHATTQPGVSAYTFLREGGEAESLTFRELEKRTRDLALALSKRAGVGERALLLYPSGLEFITAFLACLYAGIIAVPATTPRKNRSANRLQAIFDDATPRLILTTSDIASTVRRAFPDVTGIIPTDTLDMTSAGGDEDLPELRPETVAFLQYTSGSTGTPKGVIVTHENLARNALTLQEGLELSEESVNVGWLPLFHDMGLIGNVLTSLYVGFPCVLMSPGTFLQRPLTWLQAITKYKATMVGAPNFGWDYCARLIKEEDKEGLDLGSIVTAYNGSEPVRADTMGDFYKAFARHGFKQESFFPCYGLAEATLFVSGGPSTRLPIVIEVDGAALEQNIVAPPAPGDGQTRQLVGCGRAWLDTLVEIVNPETGARCADGRIGEVWVSGGSIARGYWQRPSETEETFQAAIADSSEGPFLRTGDLGFMLNGELFITGRRKDLIIIRGRNIYPQDIERTVERIADFVKPNACAAFAIEADGREALGMVIEADRALVRAAQRSSRESAPPEGIEELVSRIRRAIVEEYEIPLQRVTFVMPGSFPRTTSGKVQRSACRSGMLKGELNEVYSFDCAESSQARPAAGERARSEAFALPHSPGTSPARAETKADFDLKTMIQDRVIAIARDEMKLKIDRVDFDTPLTSLGIDSVGMVTLAVDLEEKTGKEISGDTLYENQTINELAAYLRNARPMGGNRKPSCRSLSRHAEPARAGGAACAAPEAVELAASREPSEIAEAAPQSPDRHDRYRQAIRRFDKWQESGKYFFHTPFSEHSSGQSEAWVVSDERRMLMLGSYSYLGLLRHPDIIGASCQATGEFGTGAHGARILTGTTVLHNSLEEKIASLMNAEDSIVYSSGFVTNIATISALVREGDVVIGDEWNHASIVDGCKFSGAAFTTFKHNDMKSLEQRLIEAEGIQKLVVVDAVYSMEGDIADMPGIVRLCKRYDAMLMVDEAHSLGVIGKTGLGVQEYFGLKPDDIDIKMGTLSKALASAGGFVAGSSEIIRFLRHNARGYLFSSAPPAPQIAAASAAIDVMKREPERIEHLRRIVKLYLDGLKALGFDTFKSETAIVPIACGLDETALEMTAICREAGLYIVPVFYPAVPMNASRLRTCVTASHTEQDVEFALEILAYAGRKTGLIK
ncbi:MAG TPA: aminotransferase class I/II-fold pyridoxal phosphate-dependent enzyme [Blastocatellia bacterium]|nr:aminotransferase class I/II-fold pyridoxal phosphate-dependent enzyme [Blastocatellia bacterium]